MAQTEINAENLVLKSFRPMLADILRHKHMNYWLKGGRGSTKSSFVSIVIVLLVMLFPMANAVIIRKVGKTLWDSVYQQMLWALDILGVRKYWYTGKAPMEFTYLPTGQKVKFRGADDPDKLKSTTFERGYCAIIWLEELDQFESQDEVSKILNSLRRGGEKFWVFGTYNPPKTAWSWVNKAVLAMKRRKNTLVHHSTYLDVAGDRPEWLGQPFIEEAEYVKNENPRQYQWEYMGEVVGSGGSVFENLREVRLSDDDIAGFDNPRFGVDFGWFPDPWRLVMCEWQRAQRRLVIFGERSANKATPAETGAMIKEALDYAGRYHDDPIWCDSADMTAIGVYRREVGLNARPAEKGGMRKGSYQWLSGLREIAIDPVRCPLTFEEFSLCEYAKDSNGEWTNDYNDGHDHSIDAVRYAVMREAIRGV